MNAKGRLDMKALREPKWHTGKSLWWLRIGKKHSKAGQPADAAFYWVGEHGDRAPANVVAQAVAKQNDWKRIVANWPAIRAGMSAMHPDRDWSEPLWVDLNDAAIQQMIDAIDREQKADEGALVQRQQVRREQRTAIVDNAVGGVAYLAGRIGVDEMIAALRRQGVLPESVPVATERPTIREAIEAFLNHERDRVKLAMGRKTTAGTFNGKKWNLYTAFGIPCATKRKAKATRTVYDTSKLLLDFNRAEIMKVVNYWFTMPQGVKSVRTVKNYLNGIKSFLNWCDNQTAYGWNKPKGFDHLFVVNEVCETIFPAFDPDLLKTVLAKGGSRTKMYGLFALLLGYYSADIATIQTKEFFNEGDDWFIKRERSKEKGGKKTGRIIRTKHWVAPELVKLIQKYHVPNNPHGLLLLNKHGLPMFRETVDGPKTSAAKSAWERACERAEVKYPFKWVRKHGWNALKRLTEKEEMAQRWGGQAQGIGKFYDDSVYIPVIDAQKRHAAELRKLGIL